MRLHRIFLVLIFIAAITHILSGCNESQKEYMSWPSQKEQREQNYEPNIVELNQFLSYFTDNCVEPFKEGQLTNKDMIRFCVLHIYKNREDLLSAYSNMEVAIEAKNIELIAKEFFDLPVRQQESILIADFRDDKYIIPYSDGAQMVFAQVETMEDSGNGLYEVYFNEYTAPNWWSGNPNDTIDDWQESDPENVPELTAKWKAKVKKIKESGSSRYTLVEYTLLERIK